ncbi:hypothetical protein QFZ60_000477 [Arthrobacter sp. B2I5]|uniref:hypothetical protein n=1 Tax=Arthrobacter sp. B2I5 TaxID=3042266 RepID=UPI0027899AB6|nr:hypothetical protein [Arthrobacter sp. B2I5]MDQ0824304.1 hypothetical protein [Arthrobacter sp. B2I5]
MGIKMGKNGKLPGENIIQAGILLCLLSVIFYFIGAFNGAGNGLIFSGGNILGLLLICVGYLKRISAALVGSPEVAGVSATKL